MEFLHTAFIIFLMSLFISINYLSGFYFCIPLNMKKKYIIAHVLISLIWGYALCINALTEAIPYSYFWNCIVELGFMFGTIYLFSTGNFVRNIFISFLAARIPTILSSAIVSLISKDFFNNFNLIEGGYKSLNIGMILFYIFINTIFVLLIRKVIIKLPQNGIIWNIIYNVFMYSFISQQVFEIIMRSINKNDFFTNKYNHIILQLASFLFIIFIIILGIVYSKSTQNKLENKILRHKIDESNIIHNSISQKKQQMHALRHEWNRQLELIRDSKGYVPSNVMQKYINEANDHLSLFMNFPLSGNLIVDTTIEKNIITMQKNNYEIEVIIAPITFDDDMDIDFVYTLEEIFDYINNHIVGLKWCRLYLRKIRNSLICTYEIGYDSTKQYIRCKLGTLIGDELNLNQHLTVTRQIIDKHQGSFLYNYDRNNITISYMFTCE